MYEEFEAAANFEVPRPASRTSGAGIRSYTGSRSDGIPPRPTTVVGPKVVPMSPVSQRRAMFESTRGKI